MTVEKPVMDGLGRVDVALGKEEWSVACEVSVTSSPQQELGNVQKCLAAGFDAVVVVSADRKVLARARDAAERNLDAAEDRVRFLSPEELFAFLEELDAQAAESEATVRGWGVRTRHQPVGEADAERRMGAISRVILEARRRLKGE